MGATAPVTQSTPPQLTLTASSRSPPQAPLPRPLLPKLACPLPSQWFPRGQVETQETLLLNHKQSVFPPSRSQILQLRQTQRPNLLPWPPAGPPTCALALHFTSAHNHCHSQIQMNSVEQGEGKLHPMPRLVFNEGLSNFYLHLFCIYLHGLLWELFIFPKNTEK